MKRLMLILVAAVALLTVAAPVAADTFTDSERTGAAAQRYDFPSTQLAMRSYMPRIMDWIDAADLTFSGVLGSVHSPVATIAALKAVPATGATARADNQTCLVDAGPTSGAALYQFDAASSTAGNDNTVVAPTAGTGRWLKIADYGDTAKLSVLISTSNGLGASLVGIEDAAPGKFTATTVEAGMREKAVELDTLEAKVIHYLAPVIADWDPTDIGAGVVNPPTSTTGDRYIANGSEAPYTVQRIYEYSGTAWVEYSASKGDTLYRDDDSVLTTFDGGQWQSILSASTLADTTSDTTNLALLGVGPTLAAKVNLDGTPGNEKRADVLIDQLTDHVIAANAALDTKDKNVTIALGAASAASAADADLVGGTVVSVTPVSGNDQPYASIPTIAGDGAVTVTLAGNSTAESVHRVTVRKAAAP